jgi:transglutaminase-like putative cysteine protease
MVLAAAVLTVDSLFFVIFCLFVLLAVMTFVSMEMRRSWRTGHTNQPLIGAVAQELWAVGDLSRLPLSVARACVVLVMSIVVGAVGLFFLIPRKASSGYLSSFSSRSDLSTGFSEEVRLGEIGAIQQSSAVVMHVKFDPNSPIPPDLRWRGVALTTFDGQRWSRSKEDGPVQTNDERFPADGSNTTRLFTGDRGYKVRYKVELEPFGARVFFVLPEALWINGRYQLLRIDSTGSVFNLDSSRGITDYSVLSQTAPPMPSHLLAIGDLGINSFVYLQLPAEFDPRVREFAEEISAGQSTDFLKASAIERYLATRFGYTLQLPAVQSKDPIANFLFERKKGHCEYFASSMVLMLRSLGIPARVINGFRGGEYNDLTSSYIVRARDAHSWVEAYFAGYGWYTFDPTPAATVGDSSPWNRFNLYADAMREFWHEWVVNYDSGHQNTIGFTVARQSHAVFDRVRGWMESEYNIWVKRAKSARVGVLEHLATWTVWMLSITMVLGAIVLGRILYGIVHRFRLVREPSIDPHSAASLWYERALKLLRRRGVRKHPAQTPQEFLPAIPASMRAQAEKFTAHYERARFGNSASDADKLPELYRELENTAKQ